MPKLKEDLTVVLPGEIYPVTLEAGTDVDGEVAEVAKQAGKLATKGFKKAPENK